MRKNNMRTAEEKKDIVLEMMNDSPRKIAEKYGISRKLLYRWKAKYLENGTKGLESMTGKTSHGYNPTTGLRFKKNKTIEDQLKLENMQLKIEVERLKKGYLVKGVGIKKEYVTIKEENMK